MAVNLYFNGEQFPLYKDGYNLSMQTKEVRKETEAGTIIRDIKRTNVPNLQVSCPVNEEWYQKLNTYGGMASITVSYFSPVSLTVSSFDGFLDNVKFDLIKDRIKTHWKASFEVKAY